MIKAILSSLCLLALARIECRAIVSNPPACTSADVPRPINPGEAQKCDFPWVCYHKYKQRCSPAPGCYCFTGAGKNSDGGICADHTEELGPRECVVDSHCQEGASCIYNTCYGVSVCFAHYNCTAPFEATDDLAQQTIEHVRQTT